MGWVSSDGRSTFDAPPDVGWITDSTSYSITAEDSTLFCAFSHQLKVSAHAR